eukprot:20957-Pleurochrysis_carterae.AAC.1
MRERAMTSDGGWHKRFGHSPRRVLERTLPDNGTARRDLRAVDVRPAAVGRMISDFGPLRSAPTDVIIGHGLFAGSWICRGVGYCKGAT